jgi:AmmeMemoRadiSam system protein B
MGVRRPVVAGTFYPFGSARLTGAIEDCFRNRLGPGKLPKGRSEERNIVSAICPHAGYDYSGPAAAHAYYHLASEVQPDTVVILGPNHTGLGGPVSIGGHDEWETPLGRVRVDKELARSIFISSDAIDIDDDAHLREHSIEVQLPFLQYIYEDFSFVPICMGFQGLETSREVGMAVAEGLKDRNGLIIASTDMSHYEPQDSASEKDRRVINHILELDEVALQQRVCMERISMCGYGPVSAAIVASKILGAEEAELLAYSTSGDVSGDYSGVVGYASIKIMK